MNFSGKFLENLSNSHGRYFMAVQGRSDNPNLPTKKFPQKLDLRYLHRISSVIPTFSTDYGNTMSATLKSIISSPKHIF